MFIFREDHMDRRTLLKSSGALAALTIMPVSSFAKSREIGVSLDTGPNHIRNLSMEKLAKDIAEASNGQVEMKIFSSASMFKDADVPLAVAQGVLDMGVPGTWQMGKALPDYNVTALPMMYGIGYEDQYAVWDGPAGQALNKKLEDKLKIKVVGRWINLGFAQMFFTEKRVTTHADLVGMKMRAPGGAANLARFKAFGATAASIPFSDLAQALQRKVVDGVLTTHESVRSSKLWDSGLKYCFQDNQTLFQYVPVMSASAWDSLGAEGQDLLTRLWEEKVDGVRALAVERQDEAQVEGAKNGIETIDATKEDLALMREKLMADQDALVEELRIDPAIVEMAQATLASRHG